jgi:hypothetical protein
MRSMRWLAIVFIVCIGCGGPPRSPYQPVAFSATAVHKACVLAMTCLSLTEFASAGTCVTSWETMLVTGHGTDFGPTAADLSRFVNCASNANSCAGAFSCASQGRGQDWCNAHPNDGCEGNVFVSCDAGWPMYTQDCTAFHLRCTTLANERGAACSDGNSCRYDFAQPCNGNRLISCAGELETSTDCGAFYGGTCGLGISPDGTRGMQCVGVGTPDCPAMPEQRQHCDGKVLVTCANGITERLDCSLLASHCDVVDGQYQCVPDATECPRLSPDSCDGNAIRSCVNGAWAEMPCSAIGKSVCLVEPALVKCL